MGEPEKGEWFMVGGRVTGFTSRLLVSAGDAAVVGIHSPKVQNLCVPVRGALPRIVWTAIVEHQCMKTMLVFFKRASCRDFQHYPE